MNTLGEDRVRLAGLSLPAKIMLTLFLLLIGCGYLVAVTNICAHHHDADLDPAMTVDDLRRVYHGIEKQVTTEFQHRKPSEMLKEISPGGKMRKHLEEGGPSAVRSLITWLDADAKEADFGRADHPLPGDPSPREVIAQCCTYCHNAKDGEMSDVPYAADAEAVPQFTLVSKVALPEVGPKEARTETMSLAPVGWQELVQISHAHILSIPVFTLIVGGLFLLTGLGPRVKLLLGPLPMLAVCLDLAGWWLARPIEPFIYMIAAAGAVFGASIGVQLLCVFGSLWFGRRTQTA